MVVPSLVSRVALGMANRKSSPTSRTFGVSVCCRARGCTTTDWQDSCLLTTDMGFSVMFPMMSKRRKRSLKSFLRSKVLLRLENAIAGVDKASAQLAPPLNHASLREILPLHATRLPGCACTTANRRSSCFAKSTSSSNLALIIFEKSGLGVHPLP